MRVLKKLIPNFIKEKIKVEINKNYLFSGWNMQTNTCPPYGSTTNTPRTFRSRTAPELITNREPRQSTLLQTAS